MDLTSIAPGAVLYFASGPDWQLVPPVRAVVVDAAPHRIVERQDGPATFRTFHPDPAGDAVVVDLHEASGPRRTAVRATDLRGPWLGTLHATGRTEKTVAEHQAAVRAVAGGNVSPEALLRLVATDTRIPDGAFTAYVRILDDPDA